MTTAKKVKKISKLGKFAGAFNTIFSVIPDTVGAVGKIVDKAAPLVERELDRHHEHRQSLIALPNVVDIHLDQAKDHLEQLGFVVVPIKAKADVKYRQKTEREVVAMSPSSGKYKAGFLVKLYYVDQEVINQSQDLYQTLSQQRQEQKEAVAQTLQKVSQVFSKKQSSD